MIKKNMKKIVLGLVVAIMLVGIVMAVDWSPSGNVNLKSYFNMTNLNYFEGFKMKGNINMENNNITNVSSLHINSPPVTCPEGSFMVNFSGDTSTCKSVNATNFNVNSSINWNNMNSINSTQMENNGGVLNIVLSWLNGLFYQKSKNIDMTANNITNISYIFLSNGAHTWRIYVNNSGSLITESA